MSAFRKKPVVIEATQWFKNGDHPEDRFSRDGVLPEGYEGGIVRYFRHPDVPGHKPCEQCGQAHHVHGWIDTLEQGHRVCPGDWIITGVKGEHYPCKPDIFAMTYEPADQPAPQGVAEVMELVGRYTASCIAATLHGTDDNQERSYRWDECKGAITAIMQERDALKANNRLLHSGQLDLVKRITELEVNYHELLYAVAHKHPDETRHQTALRHIMRAEKAHGSDGAGAASSKDPSHG